MNPSEPSNDLSQNFWNWFEAIFTHEVLTDYTKVYTKYAIQNIEGDDAELSTLNRLRNIQKSYRREIRFELAKLYAKPFGLPFTQTYATKLLKALFSESASSEAINQAFASKGRTSKEPRVRFSPVIDSIDQEAINLINHLYAAGCQRLDNELLPEAQEHALKKHGHSGARKTETQASLF